VDTRRTIPRPENAPVETPARERKSAGMDCAGSVYRLVDAWAIARDLDYFDNTNEPTAEELEALERLDWDTFASLQEDSI